MTDIEYELIDQLYFVQRFSDLCQHMDMTENDLKNALKGIFEKGWMKVMDLNTEAEITDADLWQKDLHHFHYLATKKGLFAHNTL